MKNLSKIFKNVLLGFVFAIHFDIVFSQDKNQEALILVKKLYYDTQNNLPKLEKVKINDTLTYFLKNKIIVKISLIEKMNQTDFFYKEEMEFAYFIFDINGKKENRFYFCLQNEGQKFSNEHSRIKMFKWIKEDKKEVSDTSKHFLYNQWEYLVKGRVMKIVAENHKIAKENETTAEALLKLVKQRDEEINLKEMIKEEKDELIDQDENNLSYKIDSKYYSKNKKTECRYLEEYFDCVGGAESISIDCKFDKIYTITINETNKFIIPEFDGYLDWGFSRREIKYCSSKCITIEKFSYAIYGTNKTYTFPYAIKSIESIN
jgi:hypothetical protein